MHSARSFFAGGLVLLLLQLGGAGAAETPRSISLAQLQSILRDPAQTNLNLYRFTGTVIYTERPSLLCLQSEKSGVVLNLPAGSTLPNLGDQIEVEAPARFGATGDDRILTPSFVKTIGPGEMPAPGNPWLLDALNGEYPGRFIEVEGVVMQTRRDNDALLIHMTDQSGWAVLTVFNWTDDIATTNWWGARLRVRAANVERGLRGIRVQGPENIKVVRPGVSSLFEAPLTNAAGLRGLPATIPDRFRLQATVLEADSENVFLRSGDTALRASYLRPYSAGSAVPHPSELLPPSIPPLAPGDVVELVGSPLQVSPYLVMSFCAFRLLGEHIRVQPQEVEARAIVSGAAAHNFVRVAGRLISRETSGSDVQTEILKVDVDGIQLRAEFAATRGGRLSAMNPDDMVEVTGLVMPAPTGFIIRLLSAADAHVLYLAPKIARERTLRTAGIAAALLIAAGGWIAFLRFKLAERERAAAAAQELNVALEQRVKERTHELEIAKEELRRTLSEERELHELKSRFISMVSHEFRTPLAIIMSSAEILEAYLDRLTPEDRAENLRDIFQATRHMGTMVEDVLLLSRFEAGKLTFRPARFDIVNLCSRLVDEVSSATNQRCPILMHPAPGLPLGYGDEALLRHILINLLHNAVKYSPVGCPVEFEIEVLGEKAVFTVRDRGIGIPEADARQLFTAFHRGRNVGETPGTGLGMVIVKSCLDLHGGSISFDTQEGSGTSFRVTVPLFTEVVEPFVRLVPERNSPAVQTA